MEYRESYEEWLKNPYFDDATKEELRSIADDDNEIKIWDGRPPRGDRSRDQPHEYLYGAQSDPGTG